MSERPAGFRIEAGWIGLDVPVGSRDEAFAWVAGRLADAGLAPNPDEVRRRLDERERIGSTVVPGGVALPHARCPGVAGVAVCLLRPARPIAFSDGGAEPVRLILAVVGSPEATAQHVAVLGHLARKIRDAAVLDLWLGSGDPREVLASIVN